MQMQGNIYLLTRKESFSRTLWVLFEVLKHNYLCLIHVHDLYLTLFVHNTFYVISLRLQLFFVLHEPSCPNPSTSSYHGYTFPTCQTKLLKHQQNVYPILGRMKANWAQTGAIVILRLSSCQSSSSKLWDMQGKMHTNWIYNGLLSFTSLASTRVKLLINESRFGSR